MINLNEMKAKDLKEMAKALQVSNWWSANKNKLIEDISLAIADRTDENPDFDIEKMFPQFVTAENVETEVEEKTETELVPMPGIDKLKDLKEEVEAKAEETQLKPKRGALIEYDGKSQNICAWGKELGISPNTLYGRIYKMNWSVEKAFTTPTRKSK